MGKGKEKNKASLLKTILMDNLLVILMVIAVIIGVCLGLGLRGVWNTWDKSKIHYLRFPGDLLLNMLKMMIIPLIVSSLISSMASLDSKASGRMGIRSVIYYLTTTLVAVIIGVVLVLSIQPGYRGGKTIDKSGKAAKSDPLNALMDLIRNCFPNNLVAACFQKQVTKVDQYEVKPPATTTAAPTNTTSSTMGTVTGVVQNVTDNVMESFFVDDPKVTTADGMNILGLVVFSLFFGAIISRMEGQGKPLADFFECLHVATMRLVTLIIWYSPIGIIFLIASKLVAMEDPEKMFAQLGYYMATVLAGLAAHGFIVLPLIYFIATRQNPFKFMYNMLKALLTAWGTASSSATLPITMNCLEEKNGVDPRVTKFVAPIGATINMDGTALYEAVASIFIAQHIGQDLGVGEVIVVSLTSTAAAIGAAGVPQAGLVTMAIVLTAVGLPVDNITLILSIDWFLDRFRTAINVLGDSYGAGIVAHLSKADLEKMDRDALGLEEVSLDVTTEDFKKDLNKNGEVNKGFDDVTKM
ncbi:hypothetical protein KUTeg_016565 [Tegillarca granosa]|uniref:Amino acid transporter n=1 Tax=Tegillarca granosa TaxID=220873 RepID=A0ABQ9ELF9_TEGGR|nr:hypothetical protein KUTeg_016565 [Tegillarca granosa]